MKLENCVDILSGYAFKSKLFNTESKGLPIIRIRDVTSNSVSTYYNGNYKDEYLVSNGDLLIGMDGQFNLVEWQGGKALLNQRVCKLIPNTKKVNKSFLKHLVPKSLKEIEDKTSFVTVKHLSVKKINEIILPEYDLKTQQKIAQILDNAAALRNKTAQLIEEYNLLAQSIFLEMFGEYLNSSNTITLEELCGKGKYGSGASAIDFTEEKGRYLRITDIDENGNLKSKKVSPSEIDDQYYLKENDIVFARSGATVGKTYLYNNKDGRLLYAGYLIKFSIPETFNSTYVYYFTKTNQYKAWVKNKQNVVAQPNINAKQYGTELRIPKAPIKLQTHFAQKIANIEAQKALARQELKESQDLFNCLLQKAFKGEL